MDKTAATSVWLRMNCCCPIFSAHDASRRSSHLAPGGGCDAVWLRAAVRRPRCSLQDKEVFVLAELTAAISLGDMAK